MSVSENINSVTEKIPSSVKLVAVSKFHTASVIKQAYNAGQRIFGESRMQEIDKKYEVLPQDIEWHFIGHLQTNKVKAILPYIHTIQSVDSWKLLQEIDKHASDLGKKISCFLEIHIAKEDAKYGLSFDDCRKLLASKEWQKLEYVNITGVMGMATNSEDENTIREEFRSLKRFFEEIKNDYFKENATFKEISMGMSDDYMIAIEEGSTMIRIGSLIFGDREY